MRAVRKRPHSEPALLLWRKIALSLRLATSDPDNSNVQFEVNGKVTDSTHRNFGDASDRCVDARF